MVFLGLLLHSSPTNDGSGVVIPTLDFHFAWEESTVVVVRSQGAPRGPANLERVYLGDCGMKSPSALRIITLLPADLNRRQPCTVFKVGLNLVNVKITGRASLMDYAN